MKQSEKTEITKKKILAAAEQEFSEKGFSAAKVDDIASRAGVNKQLIYAHYISKDNLYATVLGIVYGRLAEYENTLMQSRFEGIETIRSIIINYFDFLMKNRSFVRLVLWENLNNVSHMGNVETKLFSGVEKLIREGIEQGIINKSVDVEQLSYSFNMFCFSAFSNVNTISKLINKDLSTEEELKKRAEHIADVLTKYIL